MIINANPGFPGIVPPTFPKIKARVRAKSAILDQHDGTLVHNRNRKGLIDFTWITKIVGAPGCYKECQGHARLCGYRRAG